MEQRTQILVLNELINLQTAKDKSNSVLTVIAEDAIPSNDGSFQGTLRLVKFETQDEIIMYCDSVDDDDIFETFTDEDEAIQAMRKTIDDMN